MNADTESNVDTARARAEKLISDGAQLLIGAFDSGHTTAIAQVAEQKGIPLVINIAASPAITEQGYKFVFRNFPTAPMILNDAFENQKEVFHACERHVRVGHGEGHWVNHAEVQHAVHDR
jgi:branched-chain amino acid transport system substrate-binding protein